MRSQKPTVLTAEQVKAARSDKRHIRGAVVEFTEDLGRVYIKRRIKFPISAEITERQVPKDKNPDLCLVTKIPVIKIIQYKTSGKIFAFGAKDDYLGSLESHDLETLAVDLLRHLKAASRYKNRTCYLRSSLARRL